VNDHSPGLYAPSLVEVTTRQLREEIRQDLADDLVRFGLPSQTPAQREQISLVAEAIVAQTEALALFYAEGRCKNLDTVIDILTRFTVGVIGLTPPSGNSRA